MEWYAKQLNINRPCFIAAMNIPTAPALASRYDLMERSRYSFSDLSQTIKRTDCGEPLMPFVEGSRIALRPFWDIPGDIEGDCYQSYINEHQDFQLSARRGVVERLQLASQKLPTHWTIVVKAGYRPYEVQLSVLHAFIDESKKVNLDWIEEQHLVQARTYVADPRIVCPPHTTGGAIDIEVQDSRSGLSVDMGCPPNTDNEIAFLHSDLLSPEQYKNRMLLLDAMLVAGFAPNPYEWWHYQYGETYWAAFYGHEETLYDILET